MNTIKRLLLKILNTCTLFFENFKKRVPVIVPAFSGNLLNDRTALITGGTQGIGFAIAEAFARNNATVIITGRNIQRINTALNALKNNNPEKAENFFGIVMDVSKPELFEAKLDEISHLIEGKKIDILVNNAGIMKGSLENVTENDFDEVLNTNVKGAYFLSRVVAKHMVKNNVAGNILNIASSSSLRPAISPYALSKWSIRGMTMGFAKSLIKYNIVVNAIAPGPTATPLLVNMAKENISCKNSPSKRFATSQEIANMAVILTSNLSRMVVGDVIYMTGGCANLTYDDINYDINF